MKAVKPLGNALRLEIESDPAAGSLTNLVKNPSGDVGGFGWLTPVAGSTLTSSRAVGGFWLSYVSPGGVASYFTTENMACAANLYAAASWVVHANTNVQYRARFEWVDSAGVLISSSAQSGYLTSATANVSIGPYQAPANTRYVRLRFDVYADAAGTNPVAGSTLIFNKATVSTATTSAALGTVRTNLSATTSLESGITGWSASGKYPGAVVQGTTGAVGTKSLQLSGPSYVQAVHSAQVPITAGKTYTLSAYGLLSTKTGMVRSTPLQLTVAFNGVLDGNRADLNWSLTELTAGQWLRKSLTFTAPTGATFVQLYAYAGNELPADGYALLDAILLEEGTVLGSFFDGSSSNTADTTYAYLNRAPVVTTRTNLVPNPSFETGLTGWTAYGRATLDRITSGGQQGPAAARLTAKPDTFTNLVTNPNFDTSISGWGPGAGTTSVVASGGRCIISGTPGVMTNRCYMNQSAAMPVTAGTVIRLGMTFWIPILHTASYTISKGGILWRWFNASGAQVGSDGLYQRAGDSSGTSIATDITVPAGATSLRIYPHLDYSISRAVDTFTPQIYIDSVYATAPVMSYFDGNTADTPTIQYAWTGTPNLSTSTRKTLTTDGGMSTTLTGITPGAAYTASAWFQGVAVQKSAEAFIEFAWKNSSGGAISTARVSGEQVSTTARRLMNAQVAPAGAASVIVTLGFYSLGFDLVFLIDGVLIEQSSTLNPYFDGSTTTAAPDYATVTRAWTGTAHASTSTETTTVTIPYSTSTSTKLAYVAPIPYVNILGTAHEITITRRALDVGTLQATLLDATLDPSQSNLIRPGRAVRLMAYSDALKDWRHVFSGTAATAEVEYVLEDPDAIKRAHVTLVATDNVAKLANQTRADGVAAIADLPDVLEGCGVPWNCNGSGNQVSAATVSRNSNASAIDQVAVTRDSVTGFAWLDRMGVLQAWDRNKISTTLAGPELNESAYSDIGVAYNSDDLINEVVVSVLLPPVDASSDSDTATYDPVRNETSIAQWGVRSATFTAVGLIDQAAVTAYANAILAANATPVVRLNTMDLTVDLTDDWSAVASWYAYLDLYDLVSVSCARANISKQQSRVTGIEHRISGPDSLWTVTLDFTASTVVASPTYVPAPAGTDDQTIASMLRPVGEVSMWYGKKADCPAGWLVMDGTTFSSATYPKLAALLGGTLLPNMTDRFPIGAGTKALNTVGGSPTKTITINEMPNHAHPQVVTANTGGTGVRRDWYADGSGLARYSQGVSTDGVGGGYPLDVMNPWLSLWFIIRAA